MGIALTDVLLFGKAQSDDVDKATLVIYRRNILRWSALGGYLDIIVKGVSPLSLPDAIADSLSYVKAFGGTEQRNLPSGYTELEYIQSTGTQYIDTGVIPSSAELRIETSFIPQNYTENINMIAGTVVQSGLDAFVLNNKILYLGGNNQCTYENSSSIVGKTVVYNGAFSATSPRRNLSGTINGVSFGKSTDDQPIDTSTITSAIRIFGHGDNYRSALKMHYFKVYENGTLVRDFVPAKNSSGVIGMYDLVSGQFFTNSGTGDFVAGPEVVPTPDTPVDIVSNNGVLKYGNVSKNLFDEDYGEIGSSFVYKPIYLGVGTYTCSYSLPQMESGTSMVYFLNGNVSSGASNRINQVDASTPRTITTSTGYVTLAYRKGDAIGLSDKLPSDYECMIEKGSTATPYEPYRLAVYTDGTVETIKDSLNNTATAEMLLKVGDYQDVQSILDGVVTRNVGVKVFDGTENFNSGQASGVQCVQIPKTVLGISSDTLPSDSLDLICTHYKAVNGSDWAQSKPNTIKVGSGYLFFNTQYVQDSTSFEAYLAEQYAAGTPVIMVYPLATPTTESVAGQTLQVTSGDNIVEITQASLNNLELEAEYQAAVSLTIQEVQDANLDPNVQVTIN